MNFFYWIRINYKRIKKRFCLIDSFCKQCGRNVHDFVVDDEVWAKVEPLIKCGHVLCYDCFCEKCNEVGLLGVWKLSVLDD